MNYRKPAATIIIFMLFASCAKDYVTGRRTFSLVSESQEIALGREADPSIVAEYGAYDDKALTEFVDGIGQAIARTSHRPDLKYTFRVVDSPIVNAFALPGGWVYFTRGILAHFNSEDELAGVMGHEVGHVVARHGAEQMSKQQLAAIGFGVGSVVSEKFREYSQLAQTGLGLMFLSYGRSHESESDRLGVEYSTKLGYDSHKMAAFFRTIGALSAESGQRLPTFLSTHPDPGGREQNVHKLTDEWRAKIDYKPKSLTRNAYLQRIDGIVYGNDPRQGFVEKNMFYHPGLRFQFPVPEGWLLQNSPTVVQMIDKDKNAMVQFQLAKEKTASAAANAFASTEGLVVQNQNSVKVHNLPAVVLESTLTTQQGELRLLSYFIGMGGNVYVFHGYTASANFSKYRYTLTSIMSGFDQLRNRAALNKKPDRIRVKPAPRNATLSATFASLRVKKEQYDELALLNGMALTDQVKRGDLIKTIGQ